MIMRHGSLPHCSFAANLIVGKLLPLEWGAGVMLKTGSVGTACCLLLLPETVCRLLDNSQYVVVSCLGPGSCT